MHVPREKQWAWLTYCACSDGRVLFRFVSFLVSLFLDLLVPQIFLLPDANLQQHQVRQQQMMKHAGVAGLTSEVAELFVLFLSWAF